MREVLPSWKTRTLPLVIGIAGFCPEALLHEKPASADSGDAAAPVRTKTRFMNPLAAKGSAVITEWISRLYQAGDPDFEQLATGLLKDAHRTMPRVADRSSLAGTSAGRVSQGLFMGPRRRRARPG